MPALRGARPRAVGSWSSARTETAQVPAETIGSCWRPARSMQTRTSSGSRETEVNELAVMAEEMFRKFGQPFQVCQTGVSNPSTVEIEVGELGQPLKMD